MTLERWRHASRWLVAAVLASAALPALAQLKVGTTIPLTGPAAVLGIGQRSALGMYPETIGGMKVEYITLDDASDTTMAVTNTRKLITEHNVDIVIGSSTSPQALAMIDVVAEAQVPMIALGTSTRIVDPVDAKRRWVYKIPPNDAIWIAGMVQHMVATGVKSVAFIGFNDAFGEGWLQELTRLAREKNIAIAAVERFNRTDTSVTAQMLKVQAANADAVMVVASGTPAALPVITLKDRGYQGKVYLNAAIASREFLQLAGKAAEGAFLTVGVALVNDQIPEANPLRKVNAEYVARFEQKMGKANLNIFAIQGYDPARILERAVPEALKRAKPGTREFRAALRDSIEGVRDLVANTGIYNFSPTDHSGLDSRAVVLVRIENGWFKYVPQ